MLGPPVSLRMWLATAMIGTAIIGVGLAYLLMGAFQERTSHAADARKAHAEAAMLAREAARGAGLGDFATYQGLLPYDRVVVREGDRVRFAGPPPPGLHHEASADALFPGGSVTVDDFSPPGGDSRLAPTVVAAAVALLMITVALAVAQRLGRAIRTPVQRAIAAADRVAAGDFSARMGTEGPRELARLGRAFDAMAARLDRLDRDQRRFLDDVAHEIATPVGTLAGFGLALADGSLSTPSERTEAAAVIEGERVRIGRLLGDLRELNTLERGDAPQPERVDLHELTCAVAARFAPAAARGEVDVRVRGRRTVVTTDRHLVETIVANLVSNAIRYTPAGGRVEISLHRDRRGVAVAVSDTGIGIAPEHRERIFDRLYRVDEARDRAHGGTGLGLAIAREAARALGAHIEVESAPGRGSEFRLALPRGGRSRTGSPQSLRVGMRSSSSD